MKKKINKKKEDFIQGMTGSSSKSSKQVFLDKLLRKNLTKIKNRISNKENIIVYIRFFRKSHYYTYWMDYR